MANTLVLLDLGDGIRAEVSVPPNSKMSKCDLDSIALHKLKCVVSRKSNPISLLSKSLKSIQSAESRLKTSV